MTIGPHNFQVIFQLMDIQVAYSCLLGRPWIHEAWVVTSTLHQKLKYVKEWEVGYSLWRAGSGGKSSLIFFLY